MKNMRREFKKFYENLIDDIEDEEKRNEMLDRLEAINEEMFELDYDIERELENQEREEESSYYTLDTEFMYANRMC